MLKLRNNLPLPRNPKQNIYSRWWLENYMTTAATTKFDGRHFPKELIIYSFMIDGENYGGSCTRGGRGTAYINCEGGFGYDATVRRMIKDGYVTYHTTQCHLNAFNDYRTYITRSFIRVTDKGRARYIRMLKKYKNK